MGFPPNDGGTRGRRVERAPESTERKYAPESLMHPPPKGTKSRGVSRRVNPRQGPAMHARARPRKTRHTVEPYTAQLLLPLFSLLLLLLLSLQWINRINV